MRAVAYMAPLVILLDEMGIWVPNRPPQFVRDQGICPEAAGICVRAPILVFVAGAGALVPAFPPKTGVIRLCS